MHKGMVDLRLSEIANEKIQKAEENYFHELKLQKTCRLEFNFEAAIRNLPA